MKLKDAIRPTLFFLALLSGCHKHAIKVTYLVAPHQDLAIAYAEPGGTIEWYADEALGDRGFPFKVYTNLPCREGTGILSSDSRHTVTCHLTPGETGSYAISFDSDDDNKTTKSSVGPPTGDNKTIKSSIAPPAGAHQTTTGSIGPPPTVMHVGPCTGCTKTPSSSKEIVGAQNNSIVLDCDSAKKSRARPSSVTVSVGDPISWTLAAGSYSTTFKLKLPAGICSDQATTITSESDTCKAVAPTAAPMSYDISISSCTNGNGQGFILINPQ